MFFFDSYTQYYYSTNSKKIVRMVKKVVNYNLKPKASCHVAVM